MLKKVSKRFVSILMAVLLIASLLPNVAMAAQINGLDNSSIGLKSSGSGTWSAEGTSINGSVTGTAAGTCSDASAKNASLEISNKKTVEALLSFEYELKLNEGSATIDGVAATQNGTFSEPINPGESITIQITSAVGSKTTEIIIRNISLVVDADITTTFEPAEGGSITANGVQVTSTYTNTQRSTESYNLVAQPASGMKFVGWYNVTNNIYMSPSATWNAMLDEPFTITAVFAEANAPVFDVAKHYFTDLNEAVSYANTSGNNKITLISDGTLPAGDYSIPSGKTLLIPFDEKQTVYTTSPATNQTYDTPKAYKTLTLADGANLTVNGVLSVSAKHTANAGAGNNFGPTGEYGFIKLSGGSNITIASGGKLYAYGYIAGDGTVTALSGGEVNELMQLADFRGGTASVGMINNSQKVFPMSQYFVQNIESKLVLQYGSTEYAYASVFLGGSATTATVPFVGSSAMFRMNSGGSVVKQYLPATDQLLIEVNGGGSINSLTLNVGASVDSANYVLPLMNNLKIGIKSGTVSLNQDMALLAGAEMSVDEGATVDIASGKSVYVYDATEWTSDNFVCSGVKFKTIKYTTSAHASRTSVQDATVDINGTVLVNGAFYTTKSGANIISSNGTGKVQLVSAAGTATKTFQATQSGSNITYKEIPITAAQLRNGTQYAGTDEEFTKTAGAIAGKEYNWNKSNAKWATSIDPITIKFDANGGTGEMADTTAMPGEEFTFPECGFTYAGHSFVGWKTDLMDTVFTAGTPFRVPSELPVTELTLRAQWETDKYTVTWKNDDGTVLETDEDVAYGTVPTYDGQTPAKAADAQYTYTFAGWDEDVAAITGDVVYTATYSSELNKYVITFMNDDGTELSKNEVEYGKVPTAPTATKEANAQYTYTFAGWDKEIVAVTGEATYTATYTTTLNEYNVSFKNDDGTVLQSSNVAYDTTPVYTGETPTKASTQQYEYTFAGWDKEIAPVTGDTVYTATYTTATRNYTIKWIIDGVETTEALAYGATPSHANPSKAADAQYTYTFKEWSPAIETVTGDATYTAVFDKTVNTYTIRFLNEDNSEVKVETLDYGTEITAPADPVKANTAEKVYTFIGWFTSDEPAVKWTEGSTVTGDVTYTANFSDADQLYTVIWLDAKGEQLNKVEGVKYNAIPNYEGDTPTKEADAQYTYTFAGTWGQTLDEETFTYTMTPNFNETLRTYEITWVIDGVESSEELAYGATPNHSNPSKEADAQYTYTFKEWSPAIETVTGDATYTAVFDKTVNTYTVTWIIDGKSETQTYAYGALPNHVDPEKAADAQYVYVFTKWDPELVGVTCDTTYTAQFDAVLNGWKQDDSGLTYYVMGELQKTGLTTIDGQVYYLDEETGYAKTGWYQNGDSLYDWMFFDETTGAAETGAVTHHEIINYFGEDTGFEIGYTFDETTHKLIKGTWVQYGENYRLRWANYFPTKTWIEQEGEKYYLNPSGFALRGVQPAPTPDGKLNGLYVFDETSGANQNRIYGNDMLYTVENTDRTYYLQNDLVNYSGLIKHDGAFYYVMSKDFTLVKGQDYKITKTNGLKDPSTYTFDEQGRMLDGIVEIDGQLYYFRDGVKTYEGLYVEYYDANGNILPSSDGATTAVYYYFTSRTFEAVKDKTYYVTKNNDLLPNGYYTFDENGQYVVKLNKSGIVEEDGQLYFYENGKRVYAGLVAEYYDSNDNKLPGPDGAAKIVYYYFTSRTFEAVKNQSYYITKNNDLLPKGTYTFDENGQYVVTLNKNGIMEENGQLYYYVNGEKTYAGLVQDDNGDYYYFTSRTFEAVKDKSYYITKNNDLMPRGTYTFDSDGRMIVD